MSTLEDFLNESAVPVGPSDPNKVSLPISTVVHLKPYKKIPGVVDQRLRDLSYSSGNTLHECPKKFQLYRLKTHTTEDPIFQSISNAFGHSCGLGAQLIFQERERSLGEILWEMFLFWPKGLPLWEEDEKAKKGFIYACICTSKLWHARRNGFLRDWSIIDYNGKPAVELSFEILLPDGFRYRGSVDAVLRNRVTGAIGVLERKTTKYQTVDPAQFKNSGQAIGYSIVLDHIFPDLSSYSVLYLAYSSTAMEEFLFDFTKTLSQRAEWIQDILFDVEMVKMYDETGIYPRRGESCFNFFRQCQYFQTCTMSVERLAKEYHPDMADNKEYDISVTIEELIDSQLRRHE